MSERANRLYELRKRKGLSQAAVAMKLNMSQSRVSGYENGEVIPSDALLLFADFYCVSVDYILKKTDDRRGVPMKELTDKEYVLLSFYRSLTDKYRTIFDGIMEGFKKSIESIL